MTDFHRSQSEEGHRSGTTRTSPPRERSDSLVFVNLAVLSTRTEAKVDHFSWYDDNQQSLADQSELTRFGIDSSFAARHDAVAATTQFRRRACRVHCAPTPTPHHSGRIPSELDIELATYGRHPQI